MVTDVNLNELFPGEKEETPLNSIPLEAKERLQAKTEEESGGLVRVPFKLKLCFQQLLKHLCLIIRASRNEENLKTNFTVRSERPVEQVCLCIF